jgi:hypothetical protein
MTILVDTSSWTDKSLIDSGNDGVTIMKAVLRRK